MRLLLVDDDDEVRDVLVRALERDGHVVRAVASAQAAREAFARLSADVVILDLALPDGSGIELCRELRTAQNPVPVLMLTAHSEIGTRVESLDAGADDFLGKPFAVAELRARVRALGRRRTTPLSTLRFARGTLSVDVAARTARRGGKKLELTAREWVVLELLAGRAGRLVPRADLLEEGWGEVSEAAAASLEVLIGRIRRKLGDGVIRTVRGAGYALETA